MNYIKGSKGSCLTIIILIYLHDDQKPENPSKQYITGFSIYHQQMLWKLQKALLLTAVVQDYFYGKSAFTSSLFVINEDRNPLLFLFLSLQRNYWLLGWRSLGTEKTKKDAVLLLPLKSLERQFFTHKLLLRNSPQQQHNCITKLASWATCWIWVWTQSVSISC